MPPELLISAGTGTLVRCFAPADPTNLIVVAAAANGEGPALPRGRMVGYTGGAVELGFGRPVYFDLDGMEIPSQNLSILKLHNHADVLGHTERIEITGHQLVADWIVSGTGEFVDQFVANSRNGIKYQSSVGLWARRWERVDAGANASVNGRQVAGPAYIVRGSMLGEISVVPWGADHKTSNSIAASAVEDHMHLLQFLRLDPAVSGTGGGGPATAAAAPGTAPAQTPPAGNAVAASGTGGIDVEAERAKVRAAFAEEHERVSKIGVIASRYPGAAQTQPDLQAKAIKEGWTLEKFELEAMRADAKRPSVPSPADVKSTVAGHPARVLEAAVLKASGISVDKHFTPQELEAADHSSVRGIGLRGIIELCAQQNGWRGRDLKSDTHECLKAAFSSADVSNILAPTANKSLQAGYSHVDNSWMEIVKFVNLNDLKPHVRLRVSIGAKAERVSEGGELKHGHIGDAKHTIEGDTFGKLLAITEKMLINDDTNALTEIPFQLGRGQALMIAEAVWGLLLSNPNNFFGTGNKNYAEGADTALSDTSVGVANQKLVDQTDPQGDLMGLVGKLLVVPSSLGDYANRINSSGEIREATSGKVVYTKNIWQGRFKPIIAPYLNHAGLTGNSAKGWYLFADPIAEAVIEAGFLDGVRVPTVESAAADFNRLGVQMRTKWNWGVALASAKGAVKMKGEA